MKKQIFILFYIFISLFIINSVSADSYSPSALIFNLNTDEIGCANASLNFSLPTTFIYDRWAKDNSIPWNANLFNESSSLHSITLDYVRSLPVGKNQFKLCMKGAVPGEYHGVVLFRLQQQGTSVVQIGIWIKATIHEKIGIPECTDGWIKTPFCKNKEIWQTWLNKDCSEEDKLKSDCSPDNCNGGVCQVPQCSCLLPTEWGQCINQQQTRTIYDCGILTNYQCVAKFQSQSCFGCVPQCSEKVCGFDGCGGSCGTCSGKSTCYNGQCIKQEPSYYLIIFFVMVVAVAIFYFVRRNKSF